jgi:hypothetical protein
VSDVNSWEDTTFAFFERLLFLCFLLSPEDGRRRNYRSLLTIFIIFCTVGTALFALLFALSGFLPSFALFAMASNFTFVLLSATARYALVRLDRDRKKYGLILKRLYIAFIFLQLIAVSWVLWKLPSSPVAFLLTSLPAFGIFLLGWRALRQIDQVPTSDGLHHPQ